MNFFNNSRSTDEGNEKGQVRKIDDLVGPTKEFLNKHKTTIAYSLGGAVLAYGASRLVTCVYEKKPFAPRGTDDDEYRSYRVAADGRTHQSKSMGPKHVISFMSGIHKSYFEIDKHSTCFSDRIAFMIEPGIFFTRVQHSCDSTVCGERLGVSVPVRGDKYVFGYLYYVQSFLECESNSRNPYNDHKLPSSSFVGNFGGSDHEFLRVNSDKGCVIQPFYFSEILTLQIYSASKRDLLGPKKGVYSLMVEHYGLVRREIRKRAECAAEISRLGTNYVDPEDGPLSDIQRSDKQAVLKKELDILYKDKASSDPVSFYSRTCACGKMTFSKEYPDDPINFGCTCVDPFGNLCRPLNEHVDRDDFCDYVKRMEDRNNAYVPPSTDDCDEQIGVEDDDDIELDFQSGFESNSSISTLSKPSYLSVIKQFAKDSFLAVRDFLSFLKFILKFFNLWPFKEKPVVPSFSLTGFLFNQLLLFVTVPLLAGFLTRFTFPVLNLIAPVRNYPRFRFFGNLRHKVPLVMFFINRSQRVAEYLCCVWLKRRPDRAYRSLLFASTRNLNEFYSVCIYVHSSFSNFMSYFTKYSNDMEEQSGFEPGVSISSRYDNCGFSSYSDYRLFRDNIFSVLRNKSRIVRILDKLNKFDIPCYVYAQCVIDYTGKIYRIAPFHYLTHSDNKEYFLFDVGFDEFLDPQIGYELICTHCRASHILSISQGLPSNLYGYRSLLCSECQEYIQDVQYKRMKKILQRYNARLSKERLLLPSSFYIEPQSGIEEMSAPAEEQGIDSPANEHDSPDIELSQQIEAQRGNRFGTSMSNKDSIQTLNQHIGNGHVTVTLDGAPAISNVRPSAPKKSSAPVKANKPVYGSHDYYRTASMEQRERDSQARFRKNWGY